MKNIFRFFSLSVLIAGMVTSGYAQRSREFRGDGNSRAGSISNVPSASRQMEPRSFPVRTFNTPASSPAIQNTPTNRQFTVQRAPERNFNQSRVTETRNFQSSSSNQRVFSPVSNQPAANQRIIASRDNYDRLNNFRNRSIARNEYQNNYRYNNYNRRYDADDRYYGEDRYYGNVYGRRTCFMYGSRYTVIPHNFISIHFGGYPYYYYGGYYYGYYDGYYCPIFPPFGLHINVLPFGYVRFFIGEIPYYYYNGIYYRQYDNSYQVVDAPMGATVSSLPQGARSVIINGEKLYELNGTYYKADRDENGNDVFVVVGKNGVINNSSAGETNNLIPDSQPLQIGDTVSQLPEGSKIVTINGQQVYETPDNIYLREENNNGTVQYQVVGK